MFGLFQWIRKRREERQLLEETKAREAEMRILREKRDHQQARALLLTLQELQRTMDPLIAAQAYNNRFCPLTRLPEEVLLHIIHFLGDDAVTLHCLQIVSGTFFRLLSRQSDIWKDTWYSDSHEIYRARSCFLQHDALRLPFRRLLQRDGRCDNCRRWNDAHMRSSFEDCKFQQRQLSYDMPGGPRVASYLDSGDQRRLYCHPCGSLHDICQFPYTYQHPGERRCLGQQGSVQLCEHVQIAWASIKAHIDDWRQKQRGGGDWQVEACLDSFNIECHDASHDTRCTASEAPTWPQARLRIGKDCNHDKVLLILEWTPHSRIDALALTADGRIPAPELRALFRRLRRLGPADTLYPPGRPGALPEMACFSPSNYLAPFVYYKTGEDDNTPPPLESFPPLPSDPWLLWLCRRGLFHGYGHGQGRNGQMIDIRPHYPRDAGGTGICWQCLAVTYAKDVMVCKTEDMTRPAVMITPTHDWLHAMDTRTYPHPQASHIRPQCRDETCTNYYRRRRDYYVCNPVPTAACSALGRQDVRSSRGARALYMFLF